MSCIFQINWNFLSNGCKIQSTKPEMCSVILPMHETIGRYGGLVLSLVASAMISDMEDRFTGVIELLSISRVWINCLSLCNLGKPYEIPRVAGRAKDQD